MKPLLKEVRQLIKDITKIDKNVFPIPIPGGLYAKPKSSFFKSSLFKRPIMWNFIQKSSIGYLTSHEKWSEDVSFSGCPLSDFEQDIQIEVRTILRKTLEKLIMKKV